MIYSALDHPDPYQGRFSKTLFGFWVYLMTDCLLFATIFAAYAVLHKNTFGGPGPKELFSLPYALAETLVLLTSSFLCGLGMLSAFQLKKKRVLLYFGATMLLGIAFLVMELNEFSGFIESGNSWERSGFLSAYFTLVGTHGLHISFGLLWAAVVMAEVVQRGITRDTLRRLACLSMFWHFLDVIWIFIFTIVYLMGVN